MWLPMYCQSVNQFIAFLIYSRLVLCPEGMYLHHVVTTVRMWKWVCYCSLQSHFRDFFVVLKKCIYFIVFIFPGRLIYTVVPIYVGETVPERIRGRLLSLLNINAAVGYLVSSIVYPYRPQMLLIKSSSSDH